MPRVNLVPTEEKRREFRRQMITLPVAGAAVAIVVLGGSYLYFDWRLRTTESELEQAKQNNASLSKQVAELQKYEDLKAQKQARLSAVTSVYQSRFRWSRMLDDLSFVIPESVSLTKVNGKVPGAVTTGTTGSRESGQRDLEFEGFTRSMPEVAVFMVRLALIPSLADVTLKKAEVEKSGGPVHFTINASLNTVGETQRPAVAPTTGERGPSSVTPTGTTPTGTQTGTTGRTTATGTGR